MSDMMHVIQLIAANSTLSEYQPERMSGENIKLWIWEEENLGGIALIYRVYNWIYFLWS